MDCSAREECSEQGDSASIAEIWKIFNCFVRRFDGLVKVIGCFQFRFVCFLLRFYGFSLLEPEDFVGRAWKKDRIVEVSISQLYVLSPPLDCLDLNVLSFVLSLVR